ncbi:MAG: 50S ribosomal protein L11 methyltransferase [Candidatus Lokiarchaeota archaeon]|nr:50S ribosomal protein L11 methyltransferase [Candidatus Lokiarchaeota archaeon]
MKYPIKKKNLISIVQSMQGFESPDIRLEQYVTDAVSTVDFLYYVAVDNGDIANNIILDLGAGTGRLGLSSLLLGAKRVYAFEIDKSAIEVLTNNADTLDLLDDVEIIQCDIAKIHPEEISELINRINAYKSRACNQLECNIICIMNPPFGVHSKNADRPFLNLAMQISDTIYSLHLSNPKTRSFIQRFIERNGWGTSTIHSQKIVLVSSYAFHKKKRKEIMADVYKMEKKRII